MHYSVTFFKKNLSAQILDKGFFSFSYVSYRIEVASKGWIVQRKYKEFSSLRIELDRLYPGILVPPIYDFTSGRGKKFEAINETKDMLQGFLNIVLAHPLLGCSDLVYAFLRQGDKEGADEFPNKLKLSTLVKVPEEVAEMKTEEGITKISLTPELSDDVEVMTESASKLKELYRKYFMRVFK